MPSAFQASAQVHQSLPFGIGLFFGLGRFLPGGLQAAEQFTHLGFMGGAVLLEDCMSLANLFSELQ